ncbi:major capsid protein [Microvirus sp.]|nr:major capsid protein [Microvirus sp.]
MSVFSSVLGNKVGRSVFDLSHVKRFTCDMGQLIPVYFDECVPGDTRKIGMQCVTRFQPLVAPILDSVDLTVHYFFVPTRLLMDKEEDWNTFLTGGVDGKDNSVSLPLFSLTSFDGTSGSTSNFPFSNNIRYGKYSLWDYFGLPVPSNDSNGSKTVSIINSNHVLSFPQRCYNLVWNEFYRDSNLCDEVKNTNSTILYRAWKKDYFTSALPWQQRGIAPALPISGTLPINLNGSVFTFGDVDNPIKLVARNPSGGSSLTRIKNAGASPNNTLATSDVVGINGSSEMGVYFGLQGKAISSNPSATVDLSNGTTFDIATLRQAFQVQRWLELNARGGVRYTEFLRSHFGISPKDEVLGRPQYIGGTKSSIVISEVLQTSRTVDSTQSEKGSPLGRLAGHGLGASSDYVCTYTSKEFGYIIGIASWMPKPSYQQGVNKIFSRKTKFDFYFPEFAHLSEQAVTNGEIYATGTAKDSEIFGYQGVYNEMRYTPSFNCADMRDTFSYWHLGRIFNSAPKLNAGFLTTNSAFDGGIRKDIFASQNEPGLIVQFANIVKAIRPLPVYGTPGFIDHVGRM